VSRTDFPTRLKSNEVEIGQGKVFLSKSSALREGCRKRKEARTNVSSRERMNTNIDLARATTKSKSKTQAVSNGRVGRRGRDGGFEERPNVGDLVE